MIEYNLEVNMDCVLTLIQLMACCEMDAHGLSGYMNCAFLIWSWMSTSSLNGNCPESET